MFDIGWSELLVIAVVAIIVVGPKDLPRLMRAFGHYASKLRRMAGEFQHQFENAMREAELEEARKAIESVGDSSRTVDLNAPVGGNLMLPKRDALANPYVSSEAAAPMVLERAAPKPRRSKLKAGKGSPPTNRTAPKCFRSGTP
jgi:sec-independent protein translocase protein TatB